MKGKKIRIAAVGDLHVQSEGYELHQRLLAHMAKKADVLVLCGDLTDQGLPAEATRLGKIIKSLSIPVVGVLGNHDFENNKQKEVEEILVKNNMVVLDGGPVEVHGVGFVGVKGFGGGFGKQMVEAWGEDTLKRFVYETINEALKLENALAKLRTAQKVVIMHYSPIRETLVGEPPEIFPFLGSSRMLAPIDNFGASLVLHGHSHYGAHKGTTPKGIPVYNVSLPLMKRLSPKQPYAVIEV